MTFAAGAWYRFLRYIGAFPRVSGERETSDTTTKRKGSMDIITHQQISRRLCGTPVAVEAGTSRVELSTSGEMAVDNTGLVHGGFIFGLADYAAMIAVNHPNVVLGGAEVRFLKPVRVGGTVTAEAKVTEEKGKKRMVRVTASCGEVRVFEGDFACFVLDRHVLA